VSGRSYPWYKAFSRLHRDPDYLNLSLEGQAVYRNLLDYANEQRERGVFPVKNKRVLALAVSSGNVELLESVLAYCSTEWVCSDGTSTIAIEGDNARFTQFALLQSGKPSDKPEAIAERVKKHRASKQTDETRYKGVTEALVTPPDKEEEVDREKENSNKGEFEGGAASYSVLTDPSPSGKPTILDQCVDAIGCAGSDRERGFRTLLRRYLERGRPGLALLEAVEDWAAADGAKAGDLSHKYNSLNKRLAAWDREFETEAESKKPTLYLIPEDDPKMMRIRREYAEEERRRQERDDSRVS
jgi:hypothetical protein